ncbi:GNAT family N-acetyltransferase [Salinimicrobium oceani]|uniref:GNAT family N-acetyltransferase n=1 Tax=Salinimicrobium oceani TaxID=2722702 RepID=A0ABX1CUC9_9FLAO|nr:GNAT family N-acetyltransferase [Salinimicrobium oceani]NJW51890.1 GNAT family N-acetyltransferase [Salinimicrobium oceani]
MTIKPLSSIPFEDLIQCFLIAFEDYYVVLPEDTEYWRARFVTARVDWDLSFGMFQKELLVGYVIHGIDKHEGKLTAYNTGTGVIPAFRANGIVDKIYAHAFPMLKEKGVETCLLEVICENTRAIRVYQRIGFSIKRKLRSFTGELPQKLLAKRLQKRHFSEVLEPGLYCESHYAWENTAAAVKLLKENVVTYALASEDEIQEYIVIDKDHNMIQLESQSGKWSELLHAAGTIAKLVKLKNVDAGRMELIKELENLGFKSSVDQFEMQMDL